MPPSIICTPPTENGVYDSFLFQQQLPEPCSLLIEDFLNPDSSEQTARRRTSPQQVVTDEPRRWAQVLFEPGDVVEVRFLPPRSVSEGVRPRQFMIAKTAIQHRVYRWAFADEIDLLVNKLSELNRGSATWWGLWDKSANRWTKVGGEPGISLNIYASANPRIATGCSTSDDVMLARSLFVDLEKITVDAALAKVAAAKMPTPTMIVVSGHGVHLYWRLLKAITDLKQWTTMQKRLIKLFGSDPAIHDPARMMRLPGFLNVNGDPAHCFIHEADPGRRYALADILPVLPSEPPKTESPNLDDGSISVAGKASMSSRRAKAYADQFEPVEENRNSSLFSRSCALVEKFDLEEDQVLSLIEEVNGKAKNPLDHTEVEEVVEKAVKHVKKKGKRRGTAAESLAASGKIS